MTIASAISRAALLALISFSCPQALAQSTDNYLTESVDEGAIGTGRDNFLTEDIDEGAIGEISNSSNEWP